MSLRRLRGISAVNHEMASSIAGTFRKWMCITCGYVYDEALGDPDGGLPPGTAWADVPADWACPDCGVGKDVFEMVEL